MICRLVEENVQKRRGKKLVIWYMILLEVLYPVPSKELNLGHGNRKTS
jgi:hypothetical protein